MRCKKTGRACDGYQTSPDTSPPTLALASNKLVQGGHSRTGSLGPSMEPPPYALPSNSDWTASEKRALDFYLNLSVPHLFSGVTSSFWGRVIPALCQQEPAIRHAVFAVSSLHENRFYGTRAARQPADLFATVQYGKALRSLQKWQFPRERNLGGTASVALPLIACALFICIEFMHGNSAAANIHISQGRRILAQFDANTLASPAAELLRREIAPIFSKLTVASFLFGSAPEPIPSRFRRTRQRSGETMHFADLAEAEQSMFELVEDGLRFAKEGRFWQHTSGAKTPQSPPSEELIALEDQREQLLTQLRRWRDAFSVVQISNFDPKSQVTQVYCHTTQIIVGMALDRREMCYDDYAAEFASVIILTRRILDEEDANNIKNDRSFSSQKALFNFDSGLIPPLYFVALKSRHPGLRRDALTLLERHSASCRRENLWDSYQAFKIAERAVALEEMRGWKIMDKDDPATPSSAALGKSALHNQGEVSMDWMPSLFDENGVRLEDSEARMLRIQPEPRPIIPYDTTEDKAATVPVLMDPSRIRDFSELRGLLTSTDKGIHPALAAEAWAALVSSSPLRSHTPSLAVEDQAASWASIYDVPACLHLPQEVRIHNAVVDPPVNGGSWASFFVEPDPFDTSRVGVYRELIHFG